MKILLMWPSGEPEMKVLLNELQKAGHEIVYWVGEWPAAHLTPKNCIFHDHYDAWDAKPAKALANIKIPPVSAGYIASMYETESMILTMMNKHYDKAPVDERKHIYYTMLAYWNFVLDTVKPEWIIYNDVPHSIYSNIFYDLARRRDIPTVCFEATGIPRRLIYYRDIWKGSDRLRKALKEASARGTTVNDLDPEIRTFYEAQKSAEGNKELQYMRDQRRLAEGVGVWVHRTKIALSSPLQFVPRTAAFLARLFVPNLRKEYRRVMQESDFSRPYVYFPLNFQPERTTSPQGGIFVDLLLAVETLSAALPEGWEIYIKEHPTQWWERSKTRYSSARYPGYYERLARIPNTRLVPIDTNTFTLTERAKTTVSVAGTASWEALMRGKKSLLFGATWFRDCPGVLPVRSVEDCKRALKEIQTGDSVNENGVVAFLKAVEETAVRAHYGKPDNLLPKIDITDSMRIIAAAACTELEHK